MNLGQLFNLSEPQLLHLEKEVSLYLPHKVIVKIELVRTQSKGWLVLLSMNCRLRSPCKRDLDMVNICSLFKLSYAPGWFFDMWTVTVNKTVLRMVPGEFHDHVAS